MSKKKEKKKNGGQYCEHPVYTEQWETAGRTSIFTLGGGAIV